MKQSKKGFVLSWFYPPGNSSEGIITYKLLSHSGFCYDVWTRENQNQNLWDRKTNETSLTADNVNVLPANNESEAQWIKNAIAYYSKHRAEYSFIMSRSMPAFAHEVAREVKRRFPDIPWIASLGDPLTGTPYLRVKTAKDNPYGIKRFIAEESATGAYALRIALSRTRRARKQIWEKDNEIVNKDLRELARINDYVIREADLVILNNEYQLAHTFSGEYQQFKKKGIVIPHAFDEALYPHSEPPAHKKIIFSYTGHLDSQRNARPFLEALTKLKARDSNLSKKMEARFYGRLSDEDKLYLLDHQLIDLVKLCGDVDYRTSLKVMHDSDWVLLFDANFTDYADTNIYFAAKLADYIGSRSRILAVTQLSGASADIVRKVGGGIVCSHSSDEVAMYLAKIVYRGFIPPAVNEAERKKYSINQVAKALDKSIETVTKEANQ